MLFSCFCWVDLLTELNIIKSYSMLYSQPHCLVHLLLNIFQTLLQYFLNIAVVIGLTAWFWSSLLDILCSCRLLHQLIIYHVEIVVVLSLLLVLHHHLVLVIIINLLLSRIILVLLCPTVLILICILSSLSLSIATWLSSLWLCLISFRPADTSINWSLSILRMRLLKLLWLIILLILLLEICICIGVQYFLSL